MINLAVNYFSRPLAIERDSQGGYDEGGNFIPDQRESESFSGSVQPARGQDLRDMPEGIREEARFILSTTREIRNDDIIVDGSCKYRVMHVWPSTLGHYTRAALGLLENDR